MSVGAIYVADKVVRSGVWAWQRLQGTSGSCATNTSEARLPQVRMPRRHEQDDPETVQMDELQTMLDQGRAAAADPYNKIHGRAGNPWVDEDEEEDRTRLIQRAFGLGDQPPVRRKKKSGMKRTDPRSEIEKVEEMFQKLVPGKSGRTA